MALKRPTVLLRLVPLLIAGARYPVNAPLISFDLSTGYRFRHTTSPTNSLGLFLLLALSGGGTRGAALSYDVLEGLAHTLWRVFLVSTLGQMSLKSPLTSLSCISINWPMSPTVASSIPCRHGFNSLPRPSIVWASWRPKSTDNAEFRRLVRDLGVSSGESNSPTRPSFATAK
jgi:hypothetical protein